MHVLFVQHAPEMGGAAKSLQLLIAAALARRWRVSLTVPNETIATYYRDLLDGEAIRVFTVAGFDHHEARTFRLAPVDMLRAVHRLGRALVGSSALVRFARARDANVIYLNSSVLIPYVATLASARTVMVVHIRERIVPGLRRRFLAWLCNRYADCVVFIGDQERQRFQLEGPQVLTVHNWSDTRALMRMSPVNADDIRTRKMRLLSLGGVSAIKGYQELVQLAAERSGEVEVRIVGAHHLGAELRPVSAANGALEILPAVADVAPHIAWADGVVFWTNAPHFPRPVYEAWLARRFVIVSRSATQSPGISARTAFIGSDDSAPALSRAVVEVASDLKEAEARAVRGYDIARELFTEKNFESIAAAIEDMIA